MSSTTALHKAIGFKTYTVTNTAPLSIQTVFNNTDGTKVTFTVLGADVRYRFDGSDPTSTVGHYIGDGLQRELYGHANLDQLRLIAVTGNATVTVTVEAPE